MASNMGKETIYIIKNNPCIKAVGKKGKKKDLDS